MQELTVGIFPVHSRALVLCLRNTLTLSAPSNALEKLEAIEVGKTGPGGGEIHARHVVHGPEEADLAVHPSVRFHPLKQLLGVVQHLQSHSALVKFLHGQCSGSGSFWASRIQIRNYLYGSGSNSKFSIVTTDIYLR
jgi:hypothetical protein